MRPRGQHFTVAADTVLDTRTGLMWQRAVPVERFTWVEAKAYAKGLRLGGYEDWRLPTKEELLSLPDPADPGMARRST